MVTIDTAKPKLKDNLLYLAANGACTCGLHAGVTARYTGRDLSGQRLKRLGPDEQLYATTLGLNFKCETCGTKGAA